MLSPATPPSVLESSGRSDLGEGPVWDERLQRLYWVDITAGRLHWLNAGSGQRETIELGQTVGFAALTGEPHRVVIGHGSALALLDLESGRTETMLQLEPVGAKLRCNDGKCDPAGCLWAGTMQWGGKTDLGCLHRVDRDLRPTVELNRLRIANGLAWNTDKGLMYFIDSSTRCIDRFDWSADAGLVRRRDTLVTFKPLEGTPDGMTIDSDGNLWVAFWDGSCVRQIDGNTGAVMARIDLPATQVTSCTFGGKDFSTLFITTAANGLSAAQRAQQPQAGAVFTVRPGARGVPCHRFAGSAGMPETSAAMSRGRPGRPA